jgi:hypothetical protein
MTEPTIPEMLAWLDQVKGYDNDIESSAIRAILEQVRASEYLSGTIAEWLVEKRRIELEAIRVFVERVSKKSDGQYFYSAVMKELAAMEQSNKVDNNAAPGLS